MHLFSTVNKTAHARVLVRNNGGIINHYGHKCNSRATGDVLLCLDEWEHLFTAHVARWWCCMNTIECTLIIHAVMNWVFLFILGKGFVLISVYRYLWVEARSIKNQLLFVINMVDSFS